MMNKPPEFNIDEPQVVDDQGRSPNKEEVTDPDVRKIEAGTNRPGEHRSAQSGEADHEQRKNSRNPHRNPVDTQRKR
jgi:hypothetical protein